ncbi:helix-turn-helix domain-containing protein [Frankia sp. AgB1.9]|uniref:helix-turn-helix domain-containing protein n=1 Tax=unclassified Frankia TaxID=2632575 RepID=UPI0027DABB46|nr:MULTISPECIES: helix-turn-helix transcriptional regulator [unclassified Frankia]MBL7486875.1 helix-turn-helix domain-containing protein [Frankia sp. AgW1.1]MBL7547238.1 helix-turn-helix domain-containing protein [Frankia sp. AgB1.9]
MSDGPNSLGEYLRARRALVTPEQAGIPQLGTRRVPGLRREEVAMLAGISADYYLRLEQGRDRGPSTQVLESLARVLRLDAAGLDYLLGLAQGQSRRPRRRERRREVVPENILALLDTITFPGFVESRYFDILAANPLAAILSPRFVVGRNRVRDFFLEPAEQDFYSDWENSARGIIAGFRTSVGSDLDDPRFVEIVGELSLASDLFRTLWARQDVVRRGGTTMTVHHPEAGALTLYREKLPIPGTAGQVLALWHAPAASPAAEKLALLASYALSVRDPASDPDSEPAQAAPIRRTADSGRPDA